MVSLPMLWVTAWVVSIAIVLILVLVVVNVDVGGVVVL